jgi:hypothetical protein
MVASIGAGANVVSLFGARPQQPAPRASGRSEEAFQSRPDDGRTPGRAVAGSAPRGLLSFDAAAALQEGETLSPEQQAQAKQLAVRDAEVRAHERAHAAAGGRHAGAPSYDYQRGPDGRDYAVGGEVAIDASAVPGDPKATIEKMEQVKAAALAPAEPSGQDRRVAAQADATRRQAELDLKAQRAAAGADASAGFEAFTAADFRSIGGSRPVAAAAAPAEPAAGRPTRPGRPSTLDISV